MYHSYFGLPEGISQPQSLPFATSWCGKYEECSRKSRFWYRLVGFSCGFSFAWDKPRLTTVLYWHILAHPASGEEQIDEIAQLQNIPSYESYNHLQVLAYPVVYSNLCIYISRLTKQNIYHISIRCNFTRPLSKLGFCTHVGERSSIHSQRCF